MSECTRTIYSKGLLTEKACTQSFCAMRNEDGANVGRIPVEGVPTVTKVLGLLLPGAEFDHISASSTFTDTLRTSASAYLRKQQPIADVIHREYERTRKVLHARLHSDGARTARVNPKDVFYLLQTDSIDKNMLGSPWGGKR